MRIDLNADAGESFGVWSMGDDSALFEQITSVNIACGFHAGDPSVMRETVRRAADAGLRIGAHPGYPDLQGFGRRSMGLTPREVEDLVLFQVAALAGVARAEGVRVAHVKAHGALYNQAARDPALASAIARAVRLLDAGLVFVGLAGSAMLDAARAVGLQVEAEAFADRAYLPDGSLAPRSLDGSVIHDPAVVAARAVRIVRDGRVTCLDERSDIAVHADTLCIHGDTPGASALAARIREALEAAGVRVAAPGT
jgi:5-oxoprolinase (ATP-hydrolysing) subunit A